MTRVISIGKVKIGGNNKIAVQSMTCTTTSDVISSIKQIEQLTAAGCDIVRVAIKNSDDALALKEIKKLTSVPIVADIHYDYRLAISSMENGADKIRINPGNLPEEHLDKIITKAIELCIPIRIGVNMGSLDKETEKKFGRTAVSLVESAMKFVEIFEKKNFFNMVLSVKSSDVKETIEAYRLLSKKCSYPLHIGLTESGVGELAKIKSAVSIGSLLIDGIGDTIRVSLTSDPVDEIRFANNLLIATGKREGVNIISCPTCGRCCFDLISFANEIDKFTKDINNALTIAIMGCVVNGPGEASHADIGIAGGDGKAVIFKKGKVVRTLSIDCALEEFKKEIKTFNKNDN